MWLRKGPDAVGEAAIHFIDTPTSGPYCGRIAPLQNTAGWQEPFQGKQDDITCRDCLDEVQAVVDEYGPWVEKGE